MRFLFIPFILILCGCIPALHSRNDNSIATRGGVLPNAPGNGGVKTSGSVPGSGAIDHLHLDSPTAAAVGDCKPVGISARNASNGLAAPATPLYVFNSADGGQWFDDAACTHASISSVALSAASPSVQRYVKFTRGGTVPVSVDDGPGGLAPVDANVPVQAPPPPPGTRYSLSGPPNAAVAACLVFTLNTRDTDGNIAPPAADSNGTITGSANVGLFASADCSADPSAPYGYTSLDIEATPTSSSGTFSAMAYAAGAESISINPVDGPVTGAAHANLQVSATCGAQTPITQLSNLVVSYSGGGLHISIKSGSAIVGGLPGGAVFLTDRRVDLNTPDLTHEAIFTCVTAIVIDAAAGNTSTPKLAWLDFSAADAGMFASTQSRVIDMSGSAGPVEIIGSPYTDTLTGSAYNDSIYNGPGGNDTIYGGGGNDVLLFGYGNDGEVQTAYGQDGEDYFVVLVSHAQVNAIGGGPNSSMGPCHGDSILPLFSYGGNSIFDLFAAYRSTGSCQRGVAEPAL